MQMMGSYKELQPGEIVNSALHNGIKYNQKVIIVKEGTYEEWLQYCIENNYKLGVDGYDRKLNESRAKFYWVVTD